MVPSSRRLVRRQRRPRHRCAGRGLTNREQDQFGTLVTAHSDPTRACLYVLTFSGWASARRTEAELTCSVLAIVSQVAGGV